MGRGIIMKKNLRKRLLSAAMAVFAVLATAACGGREAEENGLEGTPQMSFGSAGSIDAAGDVSSSAGDVPEKPDTISWWTHDGLNERNGADEWFAEFERLTGIHLDHQFIPNNEYYTKLQLAFASNEVPEVFDLNGANLALYASQGAVRDLTELLMESDLYDRVDPAVWESVSIGGRIFAIPKEVPSAAATFVRGDWLERLGMEAPGNYEEFLNMLRRFKNEIPECKIPLTAPGVNNERNLPEFYQGAHFGFFKADGEWVDGFAQPEMAEAMRRMQDAYREGLMDPAVITNTTSTCRDAWYVGDVGVFNYWTGKWGAALQDRLAANVPGGTAMPLEPIAEAEYYYETLGGLCISSKVSDQKAEQIFKYFIEYMHDGGEGQVLFQSGVEGVHWRQNGDMIEPLPSLDDPTAVTASVWITPWLAISPLEAADKKTGQASAVFESLAITDAYAQPVVIMPISVTLNRITSDLEREKNNILAKVVTGEMTVEAGVEAYRKIAGELDVAQVLRELNAD